MITRRSLLGGLAGLLVAPAIVRAGSIMPVRAPIVASAADITVADLYAYNYVHKMISIGYVLTREAIADNLYRERFRASEALA